MYTGNANLWTRKEYLADLVSAKFVDLPAHDLLSEDHDELDEKMSESDKMNPLERFRRRLSTHLAKFSSFLSLSILSGGGTVNTLMTEDTFGFRKLIVAASRRGMIVAIDTLTGDIAWERYLGEDGIFKKIEQLRSASVKFPPVLAVVSTIPGVCAEARSYRNRKTQEQLSIDLTRPRAVTIPIKRFPAEQSTRLVLSRCSILNAGSLWIIRM